MKSNSANDTQFENPTVEDIVRALESVYGPPDTVAATGSTYWFIGGDWIEECEKSWDEHEPCPACDGPADVWDIAAGTADCPECGGHGYKLCGDRYAFRCRYPPSSVDILYGPRHGSSVDIEPKQEGGIKVRVSDHGGLPYENQVEFYEGVPFSLNEARRKIEAATKANKPRTAVKGSRKRAGQAAAESKAAAQPAGNADPATA